MKYSVIIPVYNREMLIKNAVDSILNQTFSDWELIIIDDASSDNTPVICDEYSLKDKRIKVIHHKINKGVSAARNTGLRNSSGEYILFLDSDDYLYPEAMAFIFENGIKNDPDIICFGITGWIPSEKISYHIHNKEEIRSKILPEHLDVSPRTDWFLQPYIWNKCFKRSIITDNSITFDENYRTWEDNDFIVSCFDKSSSMILLSKQLHKIGTGRTNDNLSTHFYPIMVWNFIESYKRNRERFGNEYDFDNPYASRRNFDITDDLVYKLKSSCNSDEFNDLIHKLISDATMSSWTERIVPKNRHEKKVKKAFKQKNEEKLRSAYSRVKKEKSGKKSFVKRVIVRLKNTLKRK